MPTDINDQQVKTAIKNLSDNIRAEFIEDNSLDLYVGKETLASIDNIKNQAIYGRRGIGKTHLLFAFREKLIQSFKEERRFPVYIDLRKILPLISNNDSLEFASLVFKFIAQSIIDQVMENINFIFDLNEWDGDNKMKSSKLKKIEEILSKFNYEFDGHEYKKISDFSLSQEEMRKISGSLAINKTPEANLSKEYEQRESQDFQKTRFISFSDITKILDEIPFEFGLRRIVILLDEWAEIPGESQPYLAELLKRSFIAGKYSLKIAAIPIRSRLGFKTDSKFIGLEEGGDVFGYSLDNRFVFEINKQQTRDFFNELLFQHLSHIDKDIFDDTAGNKSNNGIINQFFANIALREILIASAGIPRDFISLFINSYDQFIINTSSSNKRIGVKHVREATVDWYKTDKKDQVDNHLYPKQLLQKIVNEIVLKKKKTHFLIPEKHSGNEYLATLIDLRVIHLRKNGYSHQDNSGVSYNVYSLDYGCYTSININQSELDSSLLSDINTIDNFRDIRRVSLEEKFFDEFLLQVGEAFKCPHEDCGEPVDTKSPAYLKQGLCNHCFKKATISA